MIEFGVFMLVVVVVLGVLTALMATFIERFTWTAAEASEGTGVSYFVEVTTTGDDLISGTYALAAATANQQIVKPFTIAYIKALIILASVDCTLYVNDISSGAPTDTIILKAGNPWEWRANCGKTVGLVGTAGVINNWYCSVVGAAVGTLKFRGIQDITP